RGAPGADVSRVAEQAHLRHSRGARDDAAAGGSRIPPRLMNGRIDGLRAFVAIAALVASGCGRDDTGPSPVGPTIACPSAQTAQSPDGNAVSVNYPAPTVSGGAAPVTATCTPASGTPFSVGTTTVTCTARDARQQAASCSFGVAVAGPPRISATKFVAFGDSITAGQLDPACPGTSSLSGPLAWQLDNFRVRTLAI